MSLSAVVNHSLGPAMARALLKTLLEDQPLLDEPLSDLLNRVRYRPADKRTLAATLRCVEAIGAQVAAQLGPLFDESRLAQPEREAVARELVLTLDVALVHGDLPLACQVEAGRLAQHLEYERPEATAAFSDAQTALYRRALAMAAAALILVYAELWDFGWRQSLQSQEQMLDYLQNMVRRQAERVTAFERDYRQAVIRTYDYHELFGIKTINEAIQRLAQLEEDTVGPVEQAIARRRRLVLCGEAGSGKTILLRWLAVRAASRTFPELLRGWNECVPFVIQLRMWVEQGFPPLEEFLGDLRRQIGEPPQHWVREQLSSGRALLLIDGVDELPQAVREVMLESLKSLVAVYPLARYIVTSRPLAVSEKQWPAWAAWTGSANFMELTLRAMDRPTSEQLIDQWHAALAPSVERPDERAALADLPGNLKRLLHQRPELRRLSSNPLLCAMICALHRENGQSLPGRRVELYRQSVEILLSKRDEGRRVERGAEYPDLSHDQKLRLICELAYDMRLGGELSRERADVAAFFDEQLKATSPANAGRGADTCTLFCEVANLLHEPVAGRIAFCHRTFHDYLAALAIVRKREVKLLLEHAADEQWFDLIVLASGQTEQEDTDKLLRGILRQDLRLKIKGLLMHNVRVLRYRLHALALACLETAEASSRAVRDKVLKQTKALFPPASDAEARIVAAGGDAVVPLLQAKPKHSQTQAESCIRALAVIGSQKALEAITGYATDQRQWVKQALVNAWDNFDRQVFARLVLLEWTVLSLWTGSSLEGIELLTNLTALDLRSTQVSDLAPLASLSNLTHLHLSQMPISDLAPLTSLSNLTRLDLDGLQISNLAPLASLSNLATVRLSRRQISDLAPFAQLPNLTSLSLSRIQFSDLTPLAQLTNLTDLSLVDMRFSDLTPLAQLTNLTDLNLVDMQISDLTPLAQLTNLTNLKLHCTQVGDLAPLAHLPNLACLRLCWTPISNLAPLAHLPNLTLLDLTGTNVCDLASLAHLTKLTELYLNDTYVCDLAPLAHIPGPVLVLVGNAHKLNLAQVRQMPNIRLL